MTRRPLGRRTPGADPSTDALETEVRRMLARRAADVSDERNARPLPAVAPADIATGRRPLRPGRWSGPALAAAVVLTVAGLGALYLNQSRSATTEAGAPTTEPSAPATTPSTVAGAGAPVAGISLDDVLASIPPGVDPLAGPPVYQGSIGELPEATVRNYLGRRLPDLRFELAETDNAEPVVVYRWSVDESGYQATGSVVVRKDAAGPAVTLATTDGVTVASLERTADKLAVLVLDDSPNRGILAADATTLAGATVGDPAIADGSPLHFELALGPVPVVVRVQREGGTKLSITELAVEPTAFPRLCGDTPPVRIDVGSQLGPLQDGPAPQSSVPALTNQAVWHHPGPENAIEIRWPADPTRLAAMAPEGLMPDVVPGQLPLAGSGNGARPGLSAGYVLAAVERSGSGGTTDPCSVFQIAIYGQLAAVEWWHTALQGELSFGLPLTVADLDPAVGPAGLGDGQPAANELVIGSDRSTQRPQVPAGACDGLPGAPAKEGTGDGTAAATPEAALEAFLAANAATIDPPLPTAGYTEVQIDSSTISYVVGGNSSPTVVVDLSRNSAGWTVDHWSASPC